MSAPRIFFRPALMAGALALALARPAAADLLPPGTSAPRGVIGNVSTPPAGNVTGTRIGNRPATFGNVPAALTGNATHPGLPTTTKKADAAARLPTLGLVSIDNKVTLVNGNLTVVKNPAADSLAVLDISTFPPKVIRATIPSVPGSVIGPPTSVALTPDQSLALVTSSLKVDPNDPTQETEDNRLTVVDLKPTSPRTGVTLPARIAATLTAGKSPAGVSVNRAGTLALVANRGDGSVSIFTIKNKTVTPAGQVQVGAADGVLAHVAFTPDGKRALVTRDGDGLLSVLNVSGANVTLAGQDVRLGARPYSVVIAPDGKMAVVANVGPGNASGAAAGAAPTGGDSLSVLDLTATPPRVAQTVPVAPTPEGLTLSPDGKWCAVVSLNGSNKAKDAPDYHDHGLLQIFRVDGDKLTPVATAPIGHWSQGALFTADGRGVIVGNMIEKNLQVFAWDGQTLQDTGKPIRLNGGPAALRAADR